MKRILCYGDSNTWGHDPATTDRFDEKTRWPRILAGSLGNGYDVIEEGLNGRTTVWDDPIEGYKSGKTYLPPCLATHHPLDMVVLMLGTNDLKKRFSLSAYDIAEGAKTLVDIIQRSDAGIGGGSPRILLLAPPPVARLSGYADMFEGAEAKSRQFSVQYARVADEMGCAFLDTSEIIVSSPVDGIHLDAGEHRKLGEAVSVRIQALMSD